MAQLRRNYDESPNAPPAAAPRFTEENLIPKSSAIARFASFTPRAPTMAMATVEQLLRGGGEQVYARWPSISKGTASGSTPTATATPSNKPVILGRDFDPEENAIHQLRASPSVLARVKEKAERWRRTLSSVQRSTSLDPNFTPSWGVSLDDIDDPFGDDDHDHDHDNPIAADEIKDAAKQHPGEVLVSEDQAAAICVKLAPDLTTVLAPTPGEEQVSDKGVSVTEYIMHKLEPGDDEKALSQMIVQAMSPRGAPTPTATNTNTELPPTALSNNVVDTVATTGSNVVGAVASVATTTSSNVVDAISGVASAATATGSNVVGAAAAAAAAASTTGSNVVGVVGKVRGAVSSLLLTSVISTPTPESNQPAEVSNDALEAVEKENEGRKANTN